MEISCPLHPGYPLSIVSWTASPAFLCCDHVTQLTVHGVHQEPTNPQRMYMTPRLSFVLSEWHRLAHGIDELQKNMAWSESRERPAFRVRGLPCGPISVGARASRRSTDPTGRVSHPDPLEVGHGNTTLQWRRTSLNHSTSNGFFQADSFMFLVLHLRG